MKGNLEFTLPEERVEFDQANRADDAYALLAELDDALRLRIKHGAETNFPGLDVSQAERIRMWIRGEALERGIVHLLP